MPKRPPNPMRPEVAALWHPTKNGAVLSSDYSGGSGFKAWWQCSLGHDFAAAIRDVSGGSGCPYCAGNKAWAGYNDLATLQPEIARQWHPTKNLPLSPTDVTVGSKTKVWWTGECSHEFIASVGNRTVSGRGCPYCAGQKILIGFNDLFTTHPDVAAQWHPTKNEGLTPYNVTAGLKRKVWWIGKCGHEFDCAIAEKTRGAGREKGSGCCPYCSGKRVLAGFNDLASNFPDIAAEWSHINTLRADEISHKSVVKAEWVCHKGHTYVASVRARTQEGSGCRYCAGYLVLPGHNDLTITHPHIAAEWHPTKNGELNPKNFSQSNDTKIWWQCPDIASHAYLSPINSRTDVRGAYGCNICNNRVIQAGSNDLFTLYPELKLEWNFDKNTTVNPEKIGRSYKHKVWWKCVKGHEWFASPCVRITSTRITKCPHCHAKTFSSSAEKDISEILKKLGEKVVVNRRSILKGLELDIYLPERKLAIEYNGLYWHTTAKNGKYLSYHYDKWLACKNAGIELIQIWEDDWLERREIVLRNLFQKIGATKLVPEKLPKIGITVLPDVKAEQTTVGLLRVKEAREFFDSNHIQGFSSGSYYIGLYDESGILCAAIALKKDKTNSFHIVRYATNRNVADGFAKLLTYTVKQYDPAKFVIVSDNCMADDSLYKEAGFNTDKEMSPDFMYRIGRKRKPKSEYTISKFKSNPALKWEPDTTARGLADLNNLERIYDAGKIRWVKDLSN